MQWKILGLSLFFAELQATTTEDCRRYLTTKCSDLRPICIEDCQDKLLQVFSLQEAQDASIATRNMKSDALGLYVNYQDSERLMIDSLPLSTEWLYLSGVTLNGEKPFNFPRENTQLSSIFLTGNTVTSLQNINFPNQTSTIKILNTGVETLENATFPSNLQLIDASFNRISTLNNLKLPNNTKQLFLSHNLLTSFENIILPSSLHTLTLNWNAIQTIRNVTFPTTLTRLYFVENPIQRISLSAAQWKILLSASNQEGFIKLEGGIPDEKTQCVTGYFGPTLKDPFFACLLGHEPTTLTGSFKS